MKTGKETHQDFNIKNGGNNMSTAPKTSPTGNENTKSQNGQTLNSTKSNMSTTAQKGQNMTKTNKSINTISNAGATPPSQKGQNMNNISNTIPSTHISKPKASNAFVLSPSHFTHDPIFEYGKTFNVIKNKFRKNAEILSYAGLSEDDFIQACYERISENQSKYNPAKGNRGQFNSGIIKNVLNEAIDKGDDEKKHRDTNSAEDYFENPTFQNDDDAENIEESTGLRTIKSHENVALAINYLEFRSATKLSGCRLVEMLDDLETAENLFGKNSIENKIFNSRYTTNTHISRPCLAKANNTSIQSIRTAEEKIKKVAAKRLECPEPTSAQISCRQYCNTEDYKKYTETFRNTKKWKTVTRR